MKVRELFSTSKWAWTLSVILVIVSGLAAASQFRNRDFDWETCDGPRLVGITMLEDLDVAQWPTGQVVTREVSDVEFPVAMAVRPGEGERYVTTLSGSVYHLGATEPEVEVLDLSDEVLVGEEQGLLGLAFSPDGDFVYLTFTDLDGTLRLVEYAMPGFTARREVLAVPQPERWHNGGNLRFGPDRNLYVGLGDGGSIGDLYGNGQDLNSIHGTIIRIDPRPEGEASYSVPSDNPFADGPVPEIYVYGLRNPWTFSFDPDTGALWIGDVGQNCVEEIDVVPAGSAGGQNFGWSSVEGDMRFREEVPEDHVGPVLAYSRQSGDCSIIWGGRYDGLALPQLTGKYLFADYCQGRVMAFSSDGERITEVVDIGVQIPRLVGFGFDDKGEAYLLGQSAGVLQLTSG